MRRSAASRSPLDLSTRIEPWQIDEDLARLARLTDCVRIYSVDFGLDRVPEIAERHGLKVLLGLWVSSHADRTKYQIDTGIALAKRFPGVIRGVIVGNEALLRGEIAPGALADLIRNVKAQVSMPVSYADVWEFWLRYRELAAAVDFVTVHILPYWEDHPIAAHEAANHVDVDPQAGGCGVRRQGDRDRRSRLAERRPDAVGRLAVTGEPGACAS